MNSFKELAPQYKVFIFDVWGVTHNGKILFPHVLETFKNLKNQEKLVFFLSNAPRPSSYAKKRLESFGLSSEFYDGIYTSGTECRELLKTRSSPFHESLGESFFHIGADISLTEGLNYRSEQSLEKADFILVSGVSASELSYYEAHLDPQKVPRPMICANYDRQVIYGNERLPCAGALAESYEKKGGKVFWHGKPLESLFQKVHEIAQEYAQDSFKKSDLLMIGDSLQTDIKGANTYGIDSVLVFSGVHHHLKNTSKEEWQQTTEHYQAFPTYQMDQVRWE